MVNIGEVLDANIILPDTNADYSKGHIYKIKETGFLYQAVSMKMVSDKKACSIKQ